MGRPLSGVCEMKDINEMIEMINKITITADRINKRIAYYHGTNFTVPSYVSEQLTDIDIIKIWAGNINRKLESEKYIENCMNGDIEK
jgi:hypothetical protein